MCGHVCGHMCVCMCVCACMCVIRFHTDHKSVQVVSVVYFFHKKEMSVVVK